MWAILLALLAVAGATEPDAPESVVPCVWDPVECPDPGVPPRPVRPVRYVGAVADATAVNVFWFVTVSAIVGTEWSQIDSASIRENVESGWAWDPDMFSTNQFAHPYHGAAFHGAARVNGLTWAEALPVALLATWEWEQFLETEAPSINDLFATTFGGHYLGEVMWRVSGLLLDETAGGAPRLGREVGAAVIDPVRGFDRLITRKAWRRGQPRVAVPLRGGLGAGVEVAAIDPTPAPRIGVYGELRYGDPFARTTLRRPMDAFEVRLDVSASPDLGARGVRLFSSGALFGRRVRLGEHGFLFVGLFEGWDYVNDPPFRVSGTAFGPGWWSRHPMGPGAELELRVTAMGTLLGAADSPWVAPKTADPLDDRDYLFGPGATLHARAEVRGDRLGTLFVETRRHWVHAAHEPFGDELASLTRSGLVLDLRGGWGLGAEVLWLSAEGWYEERAHHAEHDVRARLHATKSW